MAIRKYTTILDKTGGKIIIPGIRILPSASAFERTVCGCGFADASQVYKCPNCGNEEFIIVDYRDKEIESRDPVIHISGGKITVQKDTFYVALRHDIEVDKRTDVLFEYDGSTCSFNRWGCANQVFPILKENIDKLPLDMQYSLKVMGIIDSEDQRLFTNLLNPLPNLEFLIRNELSDYPNFIKTILKRDYSGYSSSKRDIDFKTMEDFFKSYRVPEEFREFIELYPDDMYSKTIGTRYGWRASPSATFEIPSNWHLVPADIKNICKYYLENHAINLSTYFSIGTVDKEVLTNSKVFSKFLKKYMMAYKDRVFLAVKESVEYLHDQGIEINENTLDVKWIFQRKNVMMFHENLSRSKEDIDEFINKCTENAVEAVRLLAESKRTRKTKNDE